MPKGIYPRTEKTKEKCRKRMLNNYKIKDKNGKAISHPFYKKKRFSITKRFLIKEYIRDGRTTVSIASEVGCSRGITTERLKEFGIKVRGHKEKFFRKDKEGKAINHPFYKRKLKESTKRKIGEKNFKSLNIELLKQKYLKDELSCKEIGLIFDVNAETIRSRLIKNGVKIRHRLPQRIKNKISKEKIGKNSYIRTLKHKKLMSEILSKPEKKKQQSRRFLKLWSNQEWKNKQVKKILKGLLKRPTSFEQKIADLCFKRNLPFIYTGDGGFLINYKNPDFVNEEDKIVIEVFYSWFKIRDYGSVENYKEFCRKKYESAGWRVIFIDELDLSHKNWEEVCVNKITGEIQYANTSS